MSLNYESIIKQMSLEEKALMMSGKTPGRQWILKNTESRPWRCLTDRTD